MLKFVECVPNFSEGRDEVKIKQIVDAARKVPGVIILDIEKDSDHHRTVLSFIAPVETAVEAMFKATEKAVELIDLNSHKGEHPRMGAMDVAPFIPIMGSTIEECVELAKKLAKRIGEELNVPAYLYDCAAQNPLRKNLAKVRKGQFEGMKEDIGKNPERVPDFGPNKMHPTAGATAVGARQQIINFNVNLNTADIEFGKALAKKIRTSGGGLPSLRGAAIFLESKNQVQISTVLTDYNTTSIKKVVDEIAKEIKPENIEITDTELIGLSSQDAITKYAIESLKIDSFDAETQVLENRLLNLMGSWQVGANIAIDAFANTEPTPGGGSAAAISGAMGCALGQMAIGITLMSKKLDESKKPALLEAKSKLGFFRSELQNCVTEDSAAFDKFMAARKLPKESAERKTEMQKAIKYAADVPLKTAKLSVEALRLLRGLDSISSSVASDRKSAQYLLDAAVKCAAENVLINISSIKDEEYGDDLKKEIEDCLAAIQAEKV
ncbi:MAG: glutamate formimidoyltransferase [Elusimicrobia bacterium]|nr:glutamate formimidoyltransferase [Elusimicrobiota bacterium]